MPFRLTKADFIIKVSGFRSKSTGWRHCRWPVGQLEPSETLSSFRVFHPDVEDPVAQDVAGCSPTPKTSQQSSKLDISPVAMWLCMWNCRDALIRIFGDNREHLCSQSGHVHAGGKCILHFSSFSKRPPAVQVGRLKLNLALLSDRRSPHRAAAAKHAFQWSAWTWTQ